MKLKSAFSVPLLILGLGLGLWAMGNASRANAEEPAFASAIAQDATEGSATAPDLSGNWQMSWTARNGNQRQATLEIKQKGSKLSGNFQGERGSASLKGTVQGSQVSFRAKIRRRSVSFSGTVEGGKMSGTTEAGTPWAATRE